MKFIASFFAGFGALVLVSPVQALELAQEMYVVGTLGRSNIAYSSMQGDNNTFVRNSITGVGAAFNSVQENTSKNGAKLQLGYRFHPNFAVEGGYVDLGKTKYSATYKAYVPQYAWWPKGPQVLSSSGNATREYSLTGWNLVGVAYYPVNDNLSLFGKLGMLRAEAKASGSGQALNGGNVTSTKWKATYGIGGDYNIDKNFGVRAEVEHFSRVGESEITGTADVNLLSLGVIGHF